MSFNLLICAPSLLSCPNSWPAVLILIGSTDRIGKFYVFPELTLARQTRQQAVRF